MTKEEIDTMWQQAMQESIKDGEMYTRYRFAKLVAEKALKEHAMQEVQRLGQEIEQEPVAHCKVRLLRSDESFPKVEIDWVNQPIRGPLYTFPPQRKPLSAEQVSEICAAWTDENGNTGSFGRRQIARAIEAAHGIKENT